MRIEKEKHKVVIICVGGAVIKGLVHINPGERVLDFINDNKEDFIAVTGAEIRYLEELRSFKISANRVIRRSSVVLNKSAIKWMEES